jgi:hypothetical protein
MSANLSTLSNALKVWYLPTMQKLLNNSTILLSRIQKDSTTQNPDGKSFTVAIHSARNDLAGIGIAELGTLPDDGNQGVINAIVPNKYTYSKIKFSGPVVRASRTNVGAFVKVADFEIRQALVDMKRRMNALLNGDGTGALAYWTTADNAPAAVDVDDNQGYPFHHLLTGQTNRTNLVDASDHTTLLNTGQLVFSVGTAGATSVNITQASGGTVAGSADGDYLVPYGATPGYQMQGILGIISAADPINAGGLLANGLHGLTVAAQPNWAAQIVGSEASRRDISTADIQRVLTLITTNTAYSESDVKFLLTHPFTKDKFVELMLNERGFYNEMTLDGGFEAVLYNKKPLVADPQHRRGRIDFIVPESLSIFRTSDFEWMGDDGAMLSRVNGQDAYEAILFHYGDLGCLVRNANGAILGIND